MTFVVCYHCLVPIVSWLLLFAVCGRGHALFAVVDVCCSLLLLCVVEVMLVLCGLLLRFCLFGDVARCCCCLVLLFVVCCLLTLLCSGCCCYLW